MGNNPVMMVDPDGEFAFLIPVAAAVVGGGLNLWSNFDKVKDFKTGIAYFGSGALGGLLSVTATPLTGGSVTSALNIGIDAATGNLPDFNNPLDVLKYTGLKALEGLSAGQSGNLVKGIAGGLGKIGWIQYGQAAPGGITKIGALSYSAPEFTVGITKVPLAEAGKAGARQALGFIDDAAKGGTKLISQFSTRTIDDAVSYAMKNKVTHVFGKAAHNLDPLVTKLGGQENTFRAVLNAANGKLPSSGVFNNISVNVGGYNVMIRGSVVNGVPKIGTMFIP
jgi:hypothetical protein